MAKQLIKICGIKDANIARLAVMSGANLIGIVFHPNSSRYVTPAHAIAISEVVRHTNAIPVAVFVNHTDYEMRDICEQTHIDTIQLHGTVSRAHHHLLPNKYKRIYVLNMSDQGTLNIDKGLKYLDTDRDLILIDHHDPGKGNLINRHRFHYNLPFSWILAGGLTPYNVYEAITDLHPNGVDVSSGVESYKGIKDAFLIQQFISEVRSHHHEKC